MTMDANRSVYDTVSKTYVKSRLEPVEQMLFERVRSEASGQRILDLGIGSGRTTPHLLGISRDYVGVDYASKMVDSAKQRFPDVDLRQLDARDLSTFPDGHFGLVVFSHNGMDYVDHEGRLRILREAFRVLRSGGRFVFSSHNLATEEARADLPAWRKFAFPEFEWKRRFLVLRAIRHGFDTARRVVNHARRLPREARHDGYAILNDCAHEYTLMTYYVSLAAARRQLSDAGFASIEAFEIAGTPATPASADPWLHYLARKP